MSKKILEIEKNVLITSECWNYYKFAIIQTIPGFEYWLTNHMKVFLEQGGRAVFGENGTMYPISYFFDLLEFKDGNILSINPNSIIEFLLNKIDANEYIIIDLNYDKIKDHNATTFRLHETLIYGYDFEKKEFITPILEGDIFKESHVAFEAVEKAYGDAWNYYKNDLQRLINRRHWFYGLTTIIKKEKYYNSNAVYDIISKFNNEANNFVYTRKKLGGSDEQKFYTGIVCLDILAKIILDKLDNGDLSDLDVLKQSCLKLYEYQNLLVKSIALLKKCNFISTESTVYIDLYERCFNRLKATVLMFDKYSITCDKSILLRISDRLHEIYVCEQEIIPRLISTINDQYLKSELKNYILTE